MPSESDPPDASQLRYLDFELEVGPGSGRDYPVAVVRSPAGEAHETMRFPFDELALENRLQALQIALLRSGGQRRQVLSPQEQTVQDFGQRLFDALFTSEVRSRYDVSQREAAGQGKGLRLKLRIQSPELAALPWEFLYDSRQGEYVCLSRHTPIVRYLELPQPTQPLVVTPPLRILGMVVSPRDLAALDVGREKQRVEEALKGLRAQGLAELHWLPGQTWRDLQRAMRSGPWHVFHFIGHGGFDRNADEGLIALADDEGLTYRLSATQLGRLLADHRSLRLAVLNACEGARGSDRDVFSSTAAILVRRGIPAVLAMQYEITDRAAIEFARTFYEALADAMPVDAAVAEARKAISLAVANAVEWGTPVLYMRSPDGVLFRLTQKPGVVRKRPPREEEREQRQQAVEASRLQMEEARTTAEQAGARQRQAEVFATVQTQAEQGQLREEQGDLTKAQIFYKQAAGDFAQLSREAEAERERLRQETLDVQQRTLAAREEAERAEARQYATGPFSQGAVAQEEADHRLQAQEFEEAIRAYRWAQGVFAQAAREAERARARQEAEAARQRMEEVKKGLEALTQWVGAKWAEAWEHEAKAEQAWQVQDYGQVVECYERAGRMYEEAWGEAEEARLRENVLEARQQADRTQAAAEQAEAPQHARELYQQGTEAKRQAEQSLAAKKWGQVVERFVQAKGLFVQALQEAQKEKARQAAVAASQRLEEAQSQAEQTGARERFLAEFVQAQDLVTQGHACVEQGEFIEAVSFYEQANQQFAQLHRQATLQAARENAEEARRQTVTARAEAEQAEAARYAAGLLSQAVAAQGEADQHWQAQQFGEAAQEYRQTQELFQQAVREARQERARQAAVAVRQLQTARERTEAARRRMEEVKEGLEALRQWTGERGTEAKGQETTAARAWQAQDYGQAAEAYERARQLYEEEWREAEEAQLRQQALEARQQAGQTQTAAEQADAQQYAQELYQRASEVQKQGEQNLAAKKWKEAAEEFVRTQEAFAQAFHSAQREKARQAAALAHKRIGEAQAKAEQARAHERFPAAFAQAQQLTAQGQACEEREELGQAVGLYEQAEQHFVQLLRQVIDQVARENAEAARQQMREVKERVRALKQWAESFWTEAQEEETRAEQAYQVQEYQRAQAGYKQACQAYEQVGGAGEHERLRQEALRVQQQALAARAEAEQTEAQRYAAGPLRQAMAAQGEAEQHWQAQQFGEAAQGYRQAQELFQQAAEEARQERTRQAAAAARQRMEEAQAEAERAGAREQLGEAFTRAQRLGKQGRVREEQADFVGALSSYEEAARSFVQLRREAVLQAAQERAEAARRRMEEVKEGLEALRRWTGGKGEEATAQEAAATRAWQAQNYEEATSLFVLARQSYAAARVEAEEEQERQRALQAQREQAEQTKAHALELQRKVPTREGWSLSIWWQRRQANRVLIKGDRLFQGGKYVEAQASYEEASSLFATLQPQVKEELSPVPRRSPWFSPSMDLALWKRSHLTLFISLGCLAVIFGRSLYNLDIFRLLEGKPTDGSLARQPEKIAKVPLPPVQEIPSLKPKEKPSVRVLEPEVPSTPSKEKPSAPPRTQETKGGEESPVSPPQVVTKAPPEPQPSASKPSKEVVKPSPAPVKEVPSTKSKEEPVVRQPVETAKLSPPPQPSIPPPLSPISEAEVTAWLETYRRAWEEKDIDKLVQLGGVPAQQANKVREALSRYVRFRVIFKDVDIRREGTRVTVSFTRVDTIDGRDRIHPDRKVFIIEKQGGSLVSRQQ